VGQVSPVVKTEDGYELIKLLAERGTPGKSLADMKTQLTGQIKNSQAQSQFEDLQDQLANLSYESPGLEESADKFGLKIQTTGLFSRQQGEGIAANPKVRTAAFSDEVLNQGNNSDLIDLNADEVVVLHLKDRQLPKLKPFSKVQGEIKQLLVKQAAEKKAQAIGQQLVSRLREDKADFTQLAKADDLQLRQFKSASRTQLGINIEVLQAAFKMPKPIANQPAVQGTQLKTGDNYAVIEVTAVGQNQPTTSPAEQQSYIDYLASRTGALAYSEYQQALHDTAKIKTYHST
jgi:peptidyl-prolyl cis-trans isomerase D